MTSAKTIIPIGLLLVIAMSIMGIQGTWGQGLGEVQLPKVGELTIPDIGGIAIGREIGDIRLLKNEKIRVTDITRDITLELELEPTKGGCNVYIDNEVILSGEGGKTVMSPVDLWKFNDPCGSQAFWQALYRKLVKTVASLETAKIISEKHDPQILLGAMRLLRDEILTRISP